MKEQKAWDEATKKMIARMSSVAITTDELLEVIDGVSEIEEEQRDFEACMMTIARLHRGNPDKAGAIMFRLEALSRLLADEGVPGWTMPHLPDGSVLTTAPVFAAAAIQPLIEKHGQVAFEREAFLQKALELADVDSIG